MDRDLKERTLNFARRIIQFYCKLPQKNPHQILGKQVLRSGTSIGANYREASRARSRAEFISKMGDCLKEIEETDYWLSLIFLEHLAPAELCQSLEDENRELNAIFTTIIKNSK